MSKTIDKNKFFKYNKNNNKYNHKYSYRHDKKRINHIFNNKDIFIIIEAFLNDEILNSKLQESYQESFNGIRLEDNIRSEEATTLSEIENDKDEVKTIFNIINDKTRMFSIIENSFGLLSLEDKIKILEKEGYTHKGNGVFKTIYRPTERNVKVTDELTDNFVKNLLYRYFNI